MISNDIVGAGPRRKKRKRVGRGIGSGLGKTCGKGTKGYHSRSGAKGRLGAEGGQMPLYRRLPRRGFNNKNFRTEYTVVNVGMLEASFEAGSTVDLKSLVDRGLVRKNSKLLKVLGDGDLNKALNVEAAAVSGSARKKIEAASGTVSETRTQKPARTQKPTRATKAK